MSTRRHLDQNYLLYGHGSVSERTTTSRPRISLDRSNSNSSSRLCLGRLPPNVNDSALKKRFEVFGDIEEVSVARDASGSATGEGYLQFRHEDDARAALRGMINSEFEGHILDLRLASDNREGQQTTHTYASSLPTESYISSALPASTTPVPTTYDTEGSGSRLYVCDYQDMETAHVCGEQFTQHNDLMHHWWKHEWENRPLKCQRDSTCVYAKKGFVTEGERDRHHNRHHPPRDPRPFKCGKPTCFYHNKGFETQRELEGHEYSHSLEFEELHCEVQGCSFESKSEEDLMLHLRQDHGVSATDLPNQHNVPPPPHRHPRSGGRDEKRSMRGTSRTHSYPDEKQELRRQTEMGGGSNEKPRHLREAQRAAEQQQQQQQDFRPFKCRIRGCKFANEGFETKRELDSHENGEHPEALRELTRSSSAASTSVVDPLNPEQAFVGTLRFGKTGHASASASSAQPPKESFETGAEFLRCNNVECPNTFTSEQSWRDHSLGCTVASTQKRCSFTDCDSTFPNATFLSAHEYDSHGIRICSSLTCNRAFHAEENAIQHMLDIHSNLYKQQGRRPRLAFISTVPAKSDENTEDGFPYDPYRCALLNLTVDDVSHRQNSGKGKEPESDASRRGAAVATVQLIGSSRTPSVDPVAPSPETRSSSFAGDEALPRYSMVIRSTSAPRFAELQRSIAAAQPAADALRRQTSSQPSSIGRSTDDGPSTRGRSPMKSSRLRDTPKTTATSTPPSVEAMQKPSEAPARHSVSRDPRYRYNSDGSRYVNGAVILSPDRHQVLVLESRDETKKTTYELPRGYWEINDQNGEASALREAWQKAGVVGRILKLIEPAPAELPDENGLADWHSYFEMEVESEKELWPNHQLWQRRWLSYREARVVLSGQPDLIRALERSIIFKRGSTGSPVHAMPTERDTSAARQVPDNQPRPKRKRSTPEARPFSARKYTTVSPATDNVAAWRKEVLPWLRRNFSHVMGNNQNGAIELLRVKNKPTICITCSDPKGLQLDQLTGVVGDLFPMQVKVGILARSGTFKAPQDKVTSQDALAEASDVEEGSEQGNPDDVDEGVEGDDGSPSREFPLPPVFGKFHQRPSCGAPIGVANDDNGGASAGTLGGVVVLAFPDGREAPYGLISHHVLEEKTESTELGVGVDDGWLVDASGARNFTIQQPSKMDLEETMDSLNMQRYYCEREKRYCDVEDGRAVRAKLALNQGLDQQALDFGQVSYSSGYDLYLNRHQMDWALVGDIPPWRLEDNIVTGADLFYDLHYDGKPKAPYPVEKTFFTFLSETFAEEGEQDMSELDPLRRVHGVGSYSGIMDGLVSSETSFFRLDGIDSEEWFFTPRYNGGLGIRGDSGTWIFDDFGKAVGQIIAYNYRTNVTYFSRMDYLFDHIKTKTKASEVFIPHEGYLAERKWKTDEMPRQEERSVHGGSMTASSLDESGTGTTASTSITVPSQVAGEISPHVKNDSGLGWMGMNR